VPLIQLLIADDHSMVRQGLRVMLAEASDIAIVGEARNGEEAIAAARDLRPDVILMDLNMPGLDGVEATRQILREQPAIKIVALTAQVEDDSVVDAVQAGATGIWLKATEYEDLVRVIREANAGGHPVHPDAVPSLMTARRAGGHNKLSDREATVLALIGEGLSNRDIADRLSLSEATVKSHVSHILDKLGLRNRAQLALYAAKHEK